LVLSLFFLILQRRLFLINNIAMKKVLLLLMALMPLAMMAEQRTANEAQAVAASYLNANAPRRQPVSTSLLPMPSARRCW
jgi:hypothetical protein